MILCSDNDNIIITYVKQVTLYSTLSEKSDTLSVSSNICNKCITYVTLIVRPYLQRVSSCCRVHENVTHGGQGLGFVNSSYYFPQDCMSHDSLLGQGCYIILFMSASLALIKRIFIVVYY